MLRAIAGSVLIAVSLWVFVLGLRAARTRKLAILGLMPASCSLGAFVWTALGQELDIVVRTAQGLTALTIGLAQAVGFSLVALPAERVWLRMVFVPVVLWAGTFAALWFVLPEHGVGLQIALAVFGALTLTAWIMLPFYGKDRGFVERNNRRLPSVRFACPRCGTRVDWTQGVAACTDCGLFMHLHWPADEAQAKRAEDAVAPPPPVERAVRFACPACNEVEEWPRGDNACSHCGLKLSIYWNTHVKKP